MHITASNWQLLSPLLDDALLLAPSARRAWLEQQTQLSATNLAHLSQLVTLADAPETDHFFQDLTGIMGAAAARNASTVPAARAAGTASAAFTVPAAMSGTVQWGDHVGPYQLLRLLGRGGMAEVWLARRSDGAYERDVALKLPLAHLPQNVAAERLLRERNVLAALEHPSIARLYDAGVAANGQPFLAMEYVEGESLLVHADRAKLDLKARAKLMLNVLDALHYAHQHLVVHRDLKPSNIIVRPDGRVTLLDFGIAKVIDSATAATQATELTQAVGSALTLAYAAPEQLLAEPVTTATDLYSAGVVMFELLTGERPFEQSERSPSALLQAIETTPVPLRVAATSDANAQAHGYDTFVAWQRAYQGDLAAICARALRREPGARYASALSMRDDLASYLLDRPVQARAGAWSYRWRKFFDRNRTAVLVSTAAAVAAVGFGAHAWQQRQDSRISAARATAIESVVKNLFDGMNPNSNAARSFTAKELLDRSRPLMLQAGAADADSRSKANMMMGKLYLDIGALTEASALFEAEINEARAAGDVRRQVWAQCLLADVQLDEDKNQLAYDSMARARQALQRMSQQPELLLAEVDYRLGTAAYFSKNYGDADRYLKSAKKTLLGLGLKGETALETLANVLIKQATLARFQGDFSTANDYFLDAQKLLQNVSGLQLIKDALAIEKLPLASNMGRFDEAIKEAERLLARFDTHATSASLPPIATATHYITALARTGRLREAGEQVNRLKADAVAANDVQRVSAMNYFNGLLALYVGDSAAALRTFNEQVAIDANAVDQPGNGASSSQSTRRNIAHALLQLGRNDEALALLRDIEATQTKLLGNEQHGDIAYTRLLLGAALLRKNEVSEASATLTRARDALLAKRGPSHWSVMLANAYLALINAAQNPTAAPSASAVNLSDRVQRELGWQYGAPELAARLKSRTQSPLITVPAVL